MDTARIPKGLRQHVLLSIGREEYRRARNYLLISAAIVPASLWGVITTGQQLMLSMQQSGFCQYFSLLFVGDSAVFAYWQELFYSLIESLPIWGTLMLIAALITFIWSGAMAVTNIRRLSMITN